MGSKGERRRGGEEERKEGSQGGWERVREMRRRSRV